MIRGGGMTVMEGKEETKIKEEGEKEKQQQQQEEKEEKEAWPLCTLSTPQTHLDATPV